MKFDRFEPSCKSGEVCGNIVILISGEERKYNKSLPGIYSHQVPIICLSAIKIPANVLSSDQGVLAWQLLCRTSNT